MASLREATSKLCKNQLSLLNRLNGLSINRSDCSIIKTENVLLL